MISSTNVMSERDGEHVPRRAPEPGASLVCRVATRICALPVVAAVGALDARLVVVLEAARRVPPAVFELVERAAP